MGSITDNNCKSPCYGCTASTGRKVGCHSTCSKYIEFRSNLDDVNSTINASKAYCRNIAMFNNDNYAKGVKHANRRHGVNRNSRRK